MLFVHEVHEVAGAREDEFEAAFRDGWMPLLAEGDDARLLWYMNHAHGSGASYNVVTITGVRDGAAWERLARRVQHRRPARVVARGRHLPARRDRQGDDPGALVADPGGRLRVGADRWPGARAAPLHGGHRLADVVARRLHPGVGRHLPSAAARVRRRHARNPHRHPGVLPERARFVAPARGDALAVHPRSRRPWCT